jgi:hypothetical protein
MIDMMNPVQMFLSGGPAMMALAVMALAIAVTGPLAGAIAAAGVRMPSSVWWIPSIGALFVGALGTAHSAYLGVQDLEAAGDPNVGWTLILVATSPDLFGRIVAGFGLTSLGAWLALGTAIHAFRSGDGRPTTPGHSAATLALWLVGTLVAMGGAYWLGDTSPMVALAPIGLGLFGLPLAIPAIKGIPEDLEARAYVAEGRVAAGSAIIAGVAILGWCAGAHAEMQTYAAAAMASDETRGALVQAGLALSTKSLWMVGIGFLSALLPAGTLMHWDLRYAADTRGMATLGLLAALLLGVAIAYATAASFESGIPLDL